MNLIFPVARAGIVRLLSGLLLLISTAVAQPTLNSISTSSCYVAGTNNNISFTTSGTFNPGNVFTAILIPPGSTTGNPVGSLTSQTGGTITISLVASLPSQGGYTLLIQSSSPVLSLTSAPFSIQSQNQTPVLTYTGVPCSAQSPVLSFATNPDQVTWYRDGNVISGANSTNYTATVPGFYSVMTNHSGCLFYSDTVRIFPNPIVSFAPLSTMDLDTVCISTLPFSLAGGAPAGGTYHGQGISDGLNFNAFQAGLQTHVITYRYTDLNGCSDSATTNITVIEDWARPQILGDRAFSFCQGDTLTLTIPEIAGRYYWNTGDTTQSIRVTGSGLWSALVAYWPGCILRTDSVETIARQPETAVAPFVNSPILAPTNTLRGTCSNGPGTQIIVFVNGTLAGTTTVANDSTWVISLATTLRGGERITARSRVDDNCDGLVDTLDVLGPL
ncbi:MAG: hypothetical protein NZ108_08170, partial [Bacteroidia bacterium]|nr:hypothetical protein [Bacteroidia bacterium]